MEENKKLREGLEFYAGSPIHHTRVMTTKEHNLKGFSTELILLDTGERAREALEDE